MTELPDRRMVDCLAYVKGLIMKDIISSIITSVLTALYQPFWFSVILSVMVLFFYLFAYHNETGGRGIRGAFSVWWQYFRGNAFFRKLFFLTFYTTMILFRTLLNRDMWMNPLSYGEDGTRYLTTECIENLMLFIPFTILLFWTAGKKILKKTTFLNIVWTGLKITFVFSLSIELLQLFLRLGTFQVSDLTYNTLGGGIGGAVYWIGHQLSVRRGAE